MTQSEKLRLGASTKVEVEQPRELARPKDPRYDERLALIIYERKRYQRQYEDLVRCLGMCPREVDHSTALDVASAMVEALRNDANGT